MCDYSLKDSRDTFDKFNNTVDREKQFCYMVDDLQYLSIVLK